MSECDDIQTFDKEEQNISNIDVSSPTSGSSGRAQSRRSFASVSYTSSSRTPSSSHSSDTKITPFYLRWTYGLNSKIPVLNLTDTDRPVIMFAASHAGILYDYEAKEMRPLQGHQNPVTSISCDNEGKWAATADEGKDSVVIVWDSVFCTPVNTVFSPHSDFGVARVAISPDSKYLVTVGMEPQPLIKFWLWTYGKDVPDDVFETTGSLGKLMSIDFNPHQNEHILVTFENDVIFLTWDEDNKLKSHYPATRTKVRGRFTDSTYLEQSHVALTANSTGYVYVWSNSFFVREFDEAPLDNNKDYNKAVRIELDAINCITSIDGIVATGNSKGHIRFYDNRLRILYWCQNFHLESIIGISFQLARTKYKIKDALDFTDVSTTFLDEPGEDEDRSVTYEEVYKQLAPSDASLERRTFIVRNFIATTATGRCVLIHFLENTCETIWNQAEAKITSIDIHETKPILVIGNAAGRIVCYNYHSNQHLVSYELPDSNLMEEDIDYPIAISCLKFSRCGIHLACGMKNGVLWFLDPTILETKIDKPYGFTAHQILKICFSTDSKYMAHFDAGKIVCLYYFNHESMQWIFNGKMRSHYKPIRDMVFSKNNKPNSEYPKLFTIGEDRHLVEYDISESTESELKIFSNERIDQTAIPLGFVWYSTPSRGLEEYFLIADNQYKFKIINDTTGMCHRTMLGPTCEAPVCKMIILPNTQAKETRKYMIFATRRHIGLQIIPIDGNPYTHIGMIGHPTEILQICISTDGRTLFTIGENDHCVLKWLINTRAVDVMHRLGGENLTPYYSKIEGGDSGWLFQEMKDLFYYMQILEQGENSPEPRKVSDRIPITRLSDLMRAIGFYPTEYELENIITDVKYRYYNETGCTEKDITFEEFVKTYVNHKPAFGVPLTSLKESFEVFEDDKGGLDRDTLIELLMEKGERMTSANIQNHLKVLFHHSHIKKMEEDLNSGDTEAGNDTDDKSDASNEFSFMPEKITYKEFIDDILGIDMNKQNLFQPAQVVTEDSK